MRSAGGSSRIRRSGRQPAAGREATVIAPHECPRTGRASRSSSAARMKPARSSAVSMNRCRPRQPPVRPWPGRSTATTLRPEAARVGPTCQNVSELEVTPWTRSSGGSVGSPHSTICQVYPAASTTLAVPVTPGSLASPPLGIECRRLSNDAAPVLRRSRAPTSVTREPPPANGWRRGALRGAA